MWSAVALLVGLALLVIVALQNTHDVAIDVLWFDFEAPLSLLVLVVVGITIVVTEAVGLIWRRRRRTQRRERDELERLRTDDRSQRAVPNEARGTS
jgi:uncharacterized integral membrane protein